MEAFAARFNDLDLVNDFGALDDLTKYGVTPAIAGGCGVIQEVVVGDVDEELCSGRVRVAGACHGKGVAVVAQAIVSFVFNRITRFFLLHAGLETATLNHEVVNDAVENGAIKKAVFNVGDKVLNGFGCFFGIKFDEDVAVIGLQLDFRVCAHCFTL